MYNRAQYLGGHSESFTFLPSTRVKKAMSLNTTQKIASEVAMPEGNFGALLQKVGASQDRDAFAAVFRYYAPRVKSYMLKNGLQESAAEEVVQNTFVTVWEKAAGYKPEKAAASTWIFTIARNKRIDALRKDRNLEINSDAPEIANATYEAEDDYTSAKEVEKLNSAIETLPPEQAELLRMAFFEDKSHSAISAETKLPLGTVKSRLRLAMDKLRGLMTVAGEKP